MCVCVSAGAAQLKGDCDRVWSANTCACHFYVIYVYVCMC